MQTVKFTEDLPPHYKGQLYLVDDISAGRLVEAGKAELVVDEAPAEAAPSVPVTKAKRGAGEVETFGL